MEIKATLQAPYTEEEKVEFIIEQNHRLGYEIRGIQPETLTSWGYTENEILEQAKQDKLQELSNKANEFATQGLVEYKEHYFELSNENRKNLQDTQEALTILGQETTQWSDYYNNLIELSVEDIQYIRLNLMLQRIQKLWIEEVPAYTELINNSTTIEEIENINIVFE